jgi:hypothetical protein
MISTAISVSETEPNEAGIARHEIVARQPGGEGRLVLFSHHDRALVDEVAAGIRRAYAIGRMDIQRQTAAVLSSLMQVPAALPG